MKRGAGRSGGGGGGTLVMLSESFTSFKSKNQPIATAKENF